MTCPRSIIERLHLLSKLLGSDELPDRAMQLSDLDGFLTGVACSPEPIPSAEWWPLIWGSGNALSAPWQRYAGELVLDRYRQILQGLSGEPPFIAPIFWHDDEGRVSAIDWCEGFADAYVLRMDSWVELIKTPDGQELLFPIFAHLFEDDGSSVMGIAEEQVEEMLEHAAGRIATVVPMIFAFWQSKRTRRN